MDNKSNDNYKKLKKRFLVATISLSVLSVALLAVLGFFTIRGQIVGVEDARIIENFNRIAVPFFNQLELEDLDKGTIHAAKVVDYGISPDNDFWVDFKTNVGAKDENGEPLHYSEDYKIVRVWFWPDSYAFDYYDL